MAIAEALGQFLQMDIILLFVGFFIFIVVAYKIFQVVFKALLIGLIGAAFPVVINFLGFNNLFGVAIELSFQNIIFFALIGIVAFVAYYILSGIVRVTKFVTSPFRRRGGVRKEVRKELEKSREREREKQRKETEKRERQGEQSG
jgi:CBS domain containing-hemolysin-like protein